MPFYRFEQFESRLLTPHLSSGAAPERFVYMLRGGADIEVEGERKRCGPGDIAHLPRGSTWSLAACAPSTRYAAVCSTAWLEQKLDSMSPEEQVRARVERKAN
ncbi:MAG: hypothetical protein GEV05_05735 [Betaproteobacteria bacterium]|nr:hypothetical protein [Betaproteobacteria bacterium]